MKSTLRHLSSWVFVILVAGIVSAYPQMCGQWTVSIELVDEQNRPIEKAFVSFIEIPEGDAANGKVFEADSEKRNVFVTKFIEGERVSKAYKLWITADGFLARTAATKVIYCRKTLEKKVLEARPADLGSSDITGIKGRTVDFNGAVIPGTVVVAENDKNNKFETRTNSEGEYYLVLPEGAYSLRIGGSPSLFCEVEVNNFLVPKFNGFMTLDIPLQGRSSHGSDRCTKVVMKFSSIKK
ncbi:MAG: carboxypeptidase-like regulatory domain-containing protein [Pyrinomonadaceae bacterium]